MSERKAESGVGDVFHPGVGGLVRWGTRPRRETIDPRQRAGPVTYTVPKADATDDAGTVFAGESYEANLLQAHSEAPAWSNDWDGLYLLRTED